MPRVFLITGTSTGFGFELVKVILAAGDIAVATARNSSKLFFEGTTDANYLALDLDVTDRASVEKAISAAAAKFGRIDVVVNNAGYGLAGEFESLSERQIRKQMEVNVFGLMWVTKAAMKQMRTQSPPGGLIQQVTSIGGQTGSMTFSIYCASKFAVEGFTEAIALEVKPEWGIKFTLIEPGGFRTDWSGRSMDFAEEKEPAYDHIDARANAAKRHMTQVGDPAKGVKAMYNLAIMEDPPIRCILGSDSWSSMERKMKSYGDNLKKFETFTKSTDVDA